MAALAFAVVLYGSTLAIFFVDRAIRARRGGLNPYHEPEVGTVVLLCFLLNLACLPYYFAKTRGGALGVVIGIAAFIGAFIAAFMAAFMVGFISALVG